MGSAGPRGGRQGSGTLFLPLLLLLLASPQARQPGLGTVDRCIRLPHAPIKPQLGRLLAAARCRS